MKTTLRLTVAVLGAAAQNLPAQTLDIKTYAGLTITGTTGTVWSSPDVPVKTNGGQRPGRLGVFRHRYHRAALLLRTPLATHLHQPFPTVVLNGSRESTSG